MDEVLDLGGAKHVDEDTKARFIKQQENHYVVNSFIVLRVNETRWLLGLDLKVVKHHSICEYRNMGLRIGQLMIHVSLS